ncbi:MAG: YggS family pyridoxal phosphate-dependent enzyme [Alphaproteobacteria bacterium]|nr:YggS family pyridoxal phosphate-dependent enzyme [Alphaproteobacteria bacterium]
MAVNIEAYFSILNQAQAKHAQLIVVSKKQTVQDIKILYDLGHRDFGENYVQELQEKQTQLPQDIRWHFIGHLQTNKLKYIAPYIYLIQSIDSLKLMFELHNQALKCHRKIPFLIEYKISQEPTKAGADTKTLEMLLGHLTQCPNIHCQGFMGMGSVTHDDEVTKNEFKIISSKFLEHQSQELSILSLGMSNDYKLALSYHSNMIRIGSLIFGNR